VTAYVFKLELANVTDLSNFKTIDVEQNLAEKVLY